MSDSKAIVAYQSRSSGEIISADKFVKLFPLYYAASCNALVRADLQLDFAAGFEAGLSEAISYHIRESENNSNCPAGSHAAAKHHRNNVFCLNGLYASLTGSYHSAAFSNDDVEAFVKSYFADCKFDDYTDKEEFVTDCIKNFISESRLKYFADRINKVDPKP